MAWTKRRSELLVVHMADETLVYDKRNDRSHCLNRVAAAVWEHCDGRATAEDIAALLSDQFGIPSKVDVVHLAIRDLDRAGLLDPRVDRQEVRGVSRRELGRRLARAVGVAVALPLISSIVAPTPAMAASCSPKFGACGAVGDPPCCTGCHCAGGGFCSGSC
ncbi:MAG TPA: PqqD family protein [Vicinamibacterales bacterium]